MTIDTSRESVERLLTNVTPGPWRVGPVDDCRVEDADGNEVSQIDGDYNHPDLWPIMEANARFIAAARELVPALLARAESAEAEVARLSTPPDDAEVAALVAELGEPLVIIEGYSADYVDTDDVRERMGKAADALTRLSHALATETAKREAMETALDKDAPHDH